MGPEKSEKFWKFELADLEILLKVIDIDILVMEILFFVMSQMQNCLFSINLVFLTPITRPFSLPTWPRKSAITLL
jgi:uncharacterized membrane protein YoaT (DUF817 family)